MPRLVVGVLMTLCLLMPAQAQALPVTPTISGSFCDTTDGFWWSGISGGSYTVYRSTYTGGNWTQWQGITQVTGGPFYGAWYGASTTASRRYSVAATDATGESYKATPVNCGTAQPFATRGVYIFGRPKVPQPKVDTGFNVLDYGAYVQDVNEAGATTPPAGIMAWLGGYRNANESNPCQFVESDQWVIDHVTPLANNPGVKYWFIDDEPNVVGCPNAPAQFAARNALIKSIDPDTPTLLVTYHVKSRNAADDQLDDFVGKADVIGLDWYSCSVSSGQCNFGRIDSQARDMDEACANASISPCRYLMVPLAVTASGYFQPSVAQMHEQFNRMRATNMEGYLVFAWNYGDPPQFGDNTALKAAVLDENGR